MGENIAMMENYSSKYNLTEVLYELEYGMMYEDAHADWGHRDNIISEDYESVSIGIAYNDQYLYLVQDFIVN